MNRLESIKDKLTEANVIRSELGELSEMDELYLKDIDYLLQRLERYEKALKEMCALEIPFSENGFTMQDMAFEALKEDTI
jgi:DNA repair exonuclease SbcCD ATPase subunit